MATVASAPGLPPRSQHDTGTLSTLPDPRSPGASPSLSRRNSANPHHPDLSNEVATLSNKLISAINHQTSLDDTLGATRHELEAARARINQLEAAAQEHADMVARGIWVSKADVDHETMELKSKLADAKKQKSVAEKDKKDIELELETLTTALFEEANQMVAAARKEREAAERRSEALRAQLNDTELLLASHQEQLTELKTVMQQMSSDRDDHESNANVSTAPSTPAMPHYDHFSKIFEAFNVAPITPGHDDIPPAPPTSFTYLLHPVLRTDLQSYDDFHALLQIPRNSTPPSRATSGTYSGLNALGIGNFTNREPTHPSGHPPSSGSTSSLSTPGTYPSAPATPNSQSPNSSVSSRDPPTSTVPLKETRFYKRALVEDIEPTLRLDTAPGLSWRVRRSVIHSMCEGDLVVEPMPAAAKRLNHPCSLCPEHRKDEAHGRTHRFRTSESETAQRYPLCTYCLNRVRACCDFLGFLRMLRDGHWRTDGVEGEKLAWEESVRLRERMFWARVGGGVVPAFLHAPKSPRSSVDAKPDTGPERSKLSTDDAARDPLASSEDPFRSDEPRLSIGNPGVSRAEDARDVGDDWETARNAPIFDDVPPDQPRADDGPSEQLRASLRDSLEGGAAEDPHRAGGQRSATPPLAGEQRLSITIPGAFEF
ncbi:MAG: hypothetical protein FRX48_08094 [Lasallia pustulata]|uniref:GDP/GTP exchange factor Sec2 N-terminal domain-containing protein n=1 Tax=Lasallia pustulata TaxID=136370 RepID=A0A5M8PIA7_9LECA|nr:MAG: hypothetical protein FRX48_08094 [Lasallia pustulata]